MPDTSPELRRIAWRDVCPWLIMFKCLGTSLTIPLLTLATAGSFLMPCGFAIADLLFRPEALTENGDVALKLRERMLRADRWPGSAPIVSYRFPDSLDDLGQQFKGSIDRFYDRFVGTWKYLLTFPRSARDMAYLLFTFLWSLLVWAFFGGAMARIAVVKLGRDERIGMWEAMRHTLRKYRSYIGAPLLPIIGIFIGLIFFWILGALMRLNFGVVLAGIVWPFALLAGFVLTVLLLGLIFGWPFMWVALGAEPEADALDAISHAYTYALLRPLRYLGYVTLGLLIGVFGFLLVYHFSEIMLQFVRGGVEWAAGSQRTGELAWIFNPISTPPESGMVVFGGWIIRIFNGLVRTVAAAYAGSFLFCAASAMYLLLRYDNERTEFDEVFVEEEESLQLPTVEKPGATSVDEKSAGGDESKSVET